MLLPLSNTLSLLRSPLIVPSIGPADLVGMTVVSLSSVLRNDGDYTIGCSFTVGGIGFTVTSLARWVVYGNSQTHTISLKSVQGVGNVLGSVDVNTSGATPGQFLFGAIDPVVLSPSTYYMIEATEYAGGDQWYDAGNGSAMSSDVVEDIDGSYDNGNDFGTGSGGPVNFRYHL